MSINGEPAGAAVNRGGRIARLNNAARHQAKRRTGKNRSRENALFGSGAVWLPQRSENLLDYLLRNRRCIFEVKISVCKRLAKGPRWLLVFRGLPHDSQCILAAVQWLAFVPIELLLKIGLSVGSFRQLRQGNLELLAIKFTDSDCRSGTEPFDDPKLSCRHGSLVSHKCEVGCHPCGNQITHGKGERRIHPCHDPPPICARFAGNLTVEGYIRHPWLPEFSKMCAPAICWSPCARTRNEIILVGVVHRGAFR